MGQTLATRNLYLRKENANERRAINKYKEGAKTKVDQAGAAGKSLERNAKPKGVTRISKRWAELKHGKLEGSNWRSAERYSATGETDRRVSSSYPVYRVLKKKSLS